ncbi:MAG TPA: Fe-S-binding domain-containing protein, partial [Terriglobales bacterium]
MNSSILSLVTFLPAVGALVLMFLPRSDKTLKYAAMGIALLTFLVSLHLPWHFQSGQPGFQYEVNTQWISSPNIHYHLGIDGISLWLVILTTFLVPL